MPILKNLHAHNLIPVVDFEKLGSDPSANLDVNYFVGHVRACLRTLSTQATSCHIFMMPNSNEEILFKKFPQTSMIEHRKLKKFIMLGDSSGAAIGSIKPKGDVNFSP